MTKQTNTDSTPPSISFIPTTPPLFTLQTLNPARGRGLYASSPIPPNTLLHVAPCLLIPSTNYKQHAQYTVLEHYLFNLPSGDKLLALGYGSMFNHSSKPNVNYIIDSENCCIKFFSGGNVVEEGVELCIFYGGNLWFDVVGDGTENEAADVVEINPFRAFCGDFDDENGDIKGSNSMFAERTPQLRGRYSVRPDRKWLPSFTDQIDKGLTTYTLTVQGQSIKVHLENRKHSTGSDIWDSAIVLSHYFPKLHTTATTTTTTNKEITNTFFHAKTVLELGSGVGAVGLLTSKLGAKQVYLTDLPENCPLLEKNVTENNLNDEVEVISLKWGKDECFRSDIDVDIIVGSDLFLPFAPDLLLPLCETLHKLMGVNTVALLAYEERFDCCLFFEFAKGFGMAVDVVGIEDLDERFRDEGRIFVLRITRGREERD